MANPGRPPLEPRIAALEKRLFESFRHDPNAALDSRLASIEGRLTAIEKRIGEMNLAFSQGYLPANVQINH